MAYNIPDNYKDQSIAPNLDQKTLNKMVWRSCFLQSSFNYERMQAVGWLYAILPGLMKFHTNKDDLAASMSHNLEFFNTHPFLVNFVMGLVLSLEQHKKNIPMIRAVRVSAMGPLGGIGDALFWFTLVPITAGITSNLAKDGNIAAPFIFLIIFNAAQFAIRFWLMNMSYKRGLAAIDLLTANAKEFTRAASLLGVFVVGALTCTSGATALNVLVPNGTTQAAIVDTVTVKASEVDAFVKSMKQSDENATLDLVEVLPDGYQKLTYSMYEETAVTIDLQVKVFYTVLPKIIPMIFTLGLYALMARRKWTPIYCILLLLAIGIIGAGPFGLWPSIWAV
jgi:PTS system N-acetylgalactosamine-specific IID component